MELNYRVRIRVYSRFEFQVTHSKLPSSSLPCICHAQSLFLALKRVIYRRACRPYRLSPIHAHLFYFTYFCDNGREIRLLLRYSRLKKSFKGFFEYMQDSWLSKKIGGMSLHRAIHFQTLEHPFACLNSSCCLLHLTYYLCLQKPSCYTNTPFLRLLLYFTCQAFILIVLNGW